MQIAPPQPLLGCHAAKDRVRRARPSRCMAKPIENQLQGVQVRSKFGRYRTPLSLLDLGSGRIPFHPMNRDPQRDPLRDGSLQKAGSRAGSFLAECYAVTIAKVAERLMSRHAAPQRLVTRGELRKAAGNFLPFVAIAECLHRSLGRHSALSESQTTARQSYCSYPASVHVRLGRPPREMDSSAARGSCSS